MISRSSVYVLFVMLVSCSSGNLKRVQNAPSKGTSDDISEVQRPSETLPKKEPGSQQTPSQSSLPSILPVPLPEAVASPGSSSEANCVVENPAEMLSTGKFSFTEFESKMTQAVNEYRIKNGKKALSPLPLIVYVSKIHSANMATGLVPFSHQGFPARIQTLKSAGLDLVDWGENCTQTFSDSRGALQGVRNWEGSPGHRENMLKSNYTHTGIGVARDPRTGLCYATQVFVQIR